MTNIRQIGDKYLLLDSLGTGGMAEIFRGKLLGEEGFEKLIVIKKLLPHLANDNTMVEQFINEARIAALLQHDNIAAIYDFGKLEGAYFIAMEYLFGKDLHTFLKKIALKEQKLPVSIALHIVAKICDAMSYAHGLKDLQDNPLNIIHRDLTPHNIFITYGGKVKVIDFGVARNELQDNKTQVGVVKGKISYMSPEQLGGGKIDSRSDIFSIGILLYEMLSGKKLYTGQTSELIPKVIKAEYIPLEELVPGLPTSIYKIVEKSLSLNIADRYQSCEDLQADIEECLFSLHDRGTPQKLKSYLTLLFKSEYEEESKNATQVMSDVAVVSEKTAHIQLSENETVQFDDEETAGGSFSLDNSLKNFLSFRFIIPVLGILGLFFFGMFVVLKQRPLEGNGVVPESNTQLEQEQVLDEVNKESRAEPDEQQKRVDKLLLLAVEEFIEGNLVQAGKHYNAVLLLDMNNIKAQNGMEKIAEDLKAKAVSQIEAGEIDGAKNTLREMTVLFVNHPATIEVRSRLSQKETDFKIQQLADHAMVAFNEYRITTPIEDCALKYFNEIKSLDENSSVYKEGYRKIADWYADLGERAFMAMNMDQAGIYVEEGLNLVPDHVRLKKLQHDLSGKGVVPYSKSVLENIEQEGRDVIKSLENLF